MSGVPARTIRYTPFLPPLTGRSNVRAARVFSRAGLDQALGSSRSVPRALVAMASQIKGVFSAADGSVRLFLEFWQQAQRDPHVWKEFIAPYRRYQEYFARNPHQPYCTFVVSPKVAKFRKKFAARRKA